MKESKAMMRKEVSFMKKKGAPKSMIKHEEAEMEGKKMRKFAEGGKTLKERIAANRASIAANKEKLLARQAAKAARSMPPPPPAGRMPIPNVGPGGRGGGAPPAPAPAAAPAGGMGGAGSNMAMLRKGGVAGSYRKAADGVAHKGKTKGTMVKMREGGSVFRKSADGIASKGKTKGKMVKMAYGGKC